MSWTRRNIQILSALLVALLAYAAIPHSHTGHHAAGADHAAGAAYAVSAVESERLLADEAHDSHSSGIRVDSDPCALCRAAAARTLAVTQPEPFHLEACGSSRCESLSATRRPELLLAVRHPARAPPRA